MTLPAALDPTSLTLVDLILVLVVVLTVAGAVRRGAGLLPGAAVLVTTVLGLWLAVSALAAWAPSPVAGAAGSSGLLRTLPAPTRALDQVGVLFHEVTSTSP